MAGLLAFQTASIAAETVWLDELDLGATHCGWSGAQRNLSVTRKPLAIGKQTFKRGLGTHAPSLLRVNLDGGTKKFTATIGIDAGAGDRGSAKFMLVGDGKKLFTSDVFKGRMEPKTIEVDLSGVKMLDMIVTDAGDGASYDQSDWADANFEVVGKKPETVRTSLAVLRKAIPRPKPPVNTRLAPQTLRHESLTLPTDRDDADAILRRTTALLKHLKQVKGIRDLSAEESQLKELEKQNTEIKIEDEDGRKDLTARLKKVRRSIALANPLLSFDNILFIKRHFCPNAETTGNHMCDQYFGFNAIEGGGLFVLEDAFSDEPKVRNVLKDSVCGNGRFEGRKLTAEGGFLSPELSFDGKEILFAYTDIEKDRRRYTWNQNNTYHIFRVNVDGSDLTQLTDGTTNDFDPCFLPSGRIAFISERRGGYGRCHGRPVPSFTLHSMNGDGSDIVMISPHETNEWQPSVDHNGMIVYTRWDYVDRGFNQAHHPWITTPDGRDSRSIHGNFSPSAHLRPHMEMDIRAIPGSHRYIATAACHHGQAYGSIVIVDPKIEDDNAMGPVKRVTPDQLFPESECATHRDPANYATAWPLSEDFYLCVYDPYSKSNAGTANSYGIYLLDSFGNKVLLYRDPEISCLSPIPLRPRRMPPTVPHKLLVGKPLAPGETFKPIDPDTLPKTAEMSLINVYNSVLPMPKDTPIVALRIIQLLPKTTPYANRPAIGHGLQKSARAVLGTVPVEKDGSAYFKLPVNLPVYFQALDAEGLAVQSMRSATYIHEGEKMTCQGCHEPRHQAPQAPVAFPEAMRRPPSEIKPDVDGSKPFSYPRLVQPVLDKHCVDCHAKEDKAADLSAGDVANNKGAWYPSYNNLRNHSYFIHNQVFTAPVTVPGQFGARASKLYQLLQKDHYKVKLSKEEMHRITLWLDCNSDFFGSYENTEQQAKGEIVQPTLE